MIDRATYADPAVLSEGIRHVFVNGVAAVRGFRLTVPAAAVVSTPAPAGARPPR